MATSWTLTATEICRDALEHLGAVGAGETVSAEDQVLALRALDAVLKKLPLSGYVWPKLSGDTALTWSALTPSYVSLPTDYYDYPLVWKTVDSELVPLTQIRHADWVKLEGKTDTAEEPTHFYISPEKVLYFWPVPTVDPVAKIQYQKIVNDASSSITPDVLQIWLYPLGYGVADALGLKFDTPQPKRMEIKQRWEEEKAMALTGSIPYEQIQITVDD